MARQKESLFKDKVREFLASLPKTFFIKIQQVTLIGDPDFVVCVNGTFVAMELKCNKRARCAPLQLYKLEKITKAGGISLVVYPENWQDVKHKLEELAYNHPRGVA